MGAAPSAAGSTNAGNTNQRKFIAYHGTSWENAQEICRTGQFIASKDGQLGRGVYVGREDKARGYAVNADVPLAPLRSPLAVVPTPGRWKG